MNLIVSSVGQGLLWALLGLGLYLAFKILDFADMTVEGTFPLGAASVVVVIIHGVNPFLATLIAIGVRMLTGLITGLLYTKGKIPSLLAGVLTMTAAYPVSLRIMGKSSISLLGQKTLFSGEFTRGLPQHFDSVFLGIVTTAIITVILIFFLSTDYGQAFIATGDNPVMAKSFGIHTDTMVIIGLTVSNGIVGLRGTSIARSNGHTDVNMGTETIVIAFASIIVSEVAFGELIPNRRLVAITPSSIIYRIILLAVLQLGFSTNDLSLISSVVPAICMMLPQLEEHIHLKKPILKGARPHE